MDFIGITGDQRKRMLETIGVKRVADLFRPIPSRLRPASFRIPPGMSEFEMLETLSRFFRGNRPLTLFVGGGAYDHYIPAAVDHLASRSEFVTAYTPYQPECSQGTLQALFEYQTLICRLTGMEVSNASLYDGGTALAEAALMALRITGRRRLVVDGAANPFSREIVKSYLASLDIEVIELSPLDGRLNREDGLRIIDGDTAALLVQTPNFFGNLEDLAPIARKVHGKGGLLIVSVNPVSLGLVKSPGEMGADIVVGDGQPLGNPLSFGGPSFGFIATRREFIRQLPGRIVAETVDWQGRRGFVLTLQAREQHIRRQKATSNICSNQTHAALRGLFFLSLLGEEGVRELARLNHDKAEYARSVISQIPGVAVLRSAPIFNEFTVKLPLRATKVVERMVERGIAAGVPLGMYYEGADNFLVITVTEKRRREEIDRLAHELEGVL
ncbi:MAG: aminomethyl-transferring glycine dehydrogenase subunit GcvPA [Desulfuromonadia bacterium]